MIVCGIDSGLKGALAVLNEHGDCESTLMPVMGSGKMIIDGGAIARWLVERDVEMVVVEMAQSMPAQGFSFRGGQAYGQILGVLQGICMPYSLVAATRWKRQLRLTTDKREGESEGQRKARMKANSVRRAIELLPRHRDQFAARVKDEARAEAALIAWWYLHERTDEGRRRIA